MGTKNNLLRNIGLIILGIGLLLLALKFSTLDLTDILAYSPESPWLASLMLLGLYCLKPAIMVIPIPVLYMAAGVMFPAGWAILLSLFGLFCEISLGYYVGKRLGGEKVLTQLEKNPKAQRLLSFKDSNSSIMCFIARFLPLPYDLVNMFFGAAGTAYPQYAVFSLLGLIPSMIPFIFMGNAVMDPMSKEFLIPFVFCGVISLLTFIIYQKWHGNKNADENDLKDA